ncbi:MAG TPA: hypothetical protein VKE22_11530 [Haliangiales bacterium]|nr:hypothetical protein [Haliangiales bacterium]
MTDVRRIHALLGKVRRRLRLQQALEWGTTAAIPGVAAALIVLWLGRMEIISAPAARAASLGVAAAVALAAALGALRRFPTALLASRLDRASGLADRLGTAVDFAARLARPPVLHPETVALMEAAIADGLRAAPRANVRAAAPFRVPRDLRALGAFAAVGALVCLLRFGPEPRPAVRAAVPPGPAPSEQTEALDHDDVQYQRDIVDDMHRVAAETGDTALEEMAKKLDELLDKAEKGEISKLEMLAKMDALEQAYQQGAATDADSDALMSQLKEQGKELAKHEPTKKLGEALQKGDLDAARKEMEGLADKLEKGALKPEEQKKLADALEKAAEKQREAAKKQDAKEAEALKKEIARLEKKLQKDPRNEELKRTLAQEKRKLDKLQRKPERPDEQRPLDRLTRNLERAAENLKRKDDEDKLRKWADEMRKQENKHKELAQKQEAKEDAEQKQKIDQQKDEVRRLEDKLKKEPGNEELKRTLAKQQRELEKLEREQRDKQESRPGRVLERLARATEKAAESLKQKNDEQQRQQSAQNMRRAADETRKAQDQMRQQQNQKRMKSQLADLKDAIRRAKPRPQGRGGRQTARGDGRSERIKEWERRAGGHKGDAESWRPQGNAADKMPWLRKDQQQSGKQWGDEHDPNVTGDPTKLADAKFKEDQLEGQKGKGPSRRATIITSAKRGFASESYSKVYADYQKVIEQVMNLEKVPPGYRYYIKRYFERIRPHTD